MGDSVESGTKKGEALTVEKMYQKKSQLEHILLRPDTYIGSVEPVTELMWVFDSETKSMVQREITYVPGLYKIFDEILVNAADNKQRDKTMDAIKITINAEENVISIWNNGQGIPVVEHKDEKMYVPTMIFGHLLTSSNYNDEEQKVTGGRNGYGAKLCNIFSTRFTVETSSVQYKKAFKQTWKDNMSKAEDVKIKSSAEHDYTKVTFSPDLKKFKMEKLDKDIVDLMCRRAYDVAASSRGVKVWLNGERLPIKTFKDYIDLYIKGKEDDIGNPLQIVYENVNERWEVAITTSEKGFQQVSFVNSIATTKGGRHVDYVADALVKNLIEIIKKKNKGGMQIKPFQIKTHMWLFINCLIVNPTFDSQTKEHMTLQAKNFGSKCALSEKFLNQVGKSNLIDQILTWAKFKAQTILEKAGGGKKKTKLKGIPKLEDANDAGSKSSLSCTLILTEGDSAKALVMSGLGVIGRDKYGVFPLRGKLLNVREATHKQIIENAEINNIIKIMGLQYKKKYETREDLETLRYGKLMIMTDQDQDGSHIKGLIVNFIHHNWPSLIKMPFLEVFITPIVKATKRNEEYSFFSIPEFEEWKNGTPNNHTYKIKYYKGLGTSTSKEAKEYFSNMDRHRIIFKYSGPECDQHIIMAFSKKCVEQRKEWLTNWMVERKRRKELGLNEEYLYTKDTKSITYKDFINKELVLFSNMDNERSIPNMVDGLKPGSRKVLFTCLKRNDKREVKVAQLAGSVAELSAYHHGEQSLMSVIINLAQNYVGSNNINLLQPIGQFGTRLHMGKDAASPRYIFTMLSPLTRLIFHPHDDPLLKYQKDDNQRIEPVWYIPIIPMMLINGADGIGTGWMTKIPNYNPRELIDNLRKMITNTEPLIPLKPFYKNFRGDIEALLDSRYVISGEIGILQDDRIEITELPVGCGTHHYKESVLEPMLNGTEKQPALITDYKEYNTDTTVRFIVTMTNDKLATAEQEGLHKVFKLQTTISLTSMVAFDKDLCLKRYDAVFDIMKEFFDLRLLYYLKRKAYLEGVLEAEAAKLSNQARFIVEKCNGTLIIENKKKAKMIDELVKNNYASDPVKTWKAQQVKQGNMDEEEKEVPADEEAVAAAAFVAVPEGGPDFDYLLGMTMWTLTLEKKEELINKKNAKVAELEALKMKTPGELWMDDLQVLSEKLDEVEEKERQEEMASLKVGSNTKEKGRKKKGGAPQADTFPSPTARRIAPEIGADIKKKAEAATRLKDRKLKGLTGRGKAKDKDGEKDEFDMIEEGAQKSVASRVGNSPNLIDKKMKEKKKELKQTKLNFGKGKGKKKSPWTDSESEGGASDEEFQVSSRVTEDSPVRRGPRRQAASNVKFNFDDDDNSVESFKSVKKNGDAFSDSEEEVVPKPKEETKKEEVKAFSSAAESSDDDIGLNSKATSKENLEESTEDLFDSLLNNKNKKNAIAITDDESGGDAKPKAKKAKPKKAPAEKKAPVKRATSSEKKKPTEKKSTKRPKKKNSDGDSDSDDMFSSPIKSKSKKKKASASDGEDDIEMVEAPPARQSVGRSRKPIKYQYDDDEDSDKGNDSEFSD
ncbi:DNA topoisomerase 2 [Halyomorpha halys]|uniref:DNA topoisomerase 2 n=1 Tax=Halyomorpha halys TaxID=286706 RepID=UPI0006D514CD|nr:DNA topoisomerase 2 [Halyomorpha halys]XP_014286492.1 DNA topoisomerase 2 [Halyomorpha halys]